MSDYLLQIDPNHLVLALLQAWLTYWTPKQHSAADSSLQTSRGLFLESLWWFMHRITGFSLGLDETAESVDCDEELNGLMDGLERDGISCEKCPRNVVRLLLCA